MKFADFFKKISLKQGLIVLSAVTVATASILYFTNKSEAKRSKREINTAFSAYISGYTAGVISSESVIKIILTQDAPGEKKNNELVGEDIFDFDPDIKGKAYWIDSRTIEFRPDNPMKSGQLYEAKFLLSKIFDIKESDLKTFKFNFRIIPMIFEVIENGLECHPKERLTMYNYIGAITTSDVAPKEDIEKMVTASVGQNSLKVDWEHKDKRTHIFKIKDVQRLADDAILNIECNGQPLNLDKKVQKEIEIPAKGNYKFLSAKVITGETSYISVLFSDPLKEDQDLLGLVEINGAGDLKTLITNNELKIYPNNVNSEVKSLFISAGVKNIEGKRLSKDVTVELVFEQIKPAIRALGQGTILPSTDGMIFPFEAVSLKAVDIKIIKIYENNIGQFLQVNDIKGEREIVRVGRPLLKKTIYLNTAGVTNLAKWNRFTLDLSEYINAEPGAIYQVSITFKRKYSIYPCENGSENGDDNLAEIEDEEDKEDAKYDNGGDYYYYDDYYYDEYEEDYNWRERDNPCNSAYYSGNKGIKRNVLASDLGIIGKRGNNGEMLFVVTDLKTTEPLNAIELELYDYQQQLLQTVKTGSDGIAKLSLDRKPFLLIAKKDNQRGYLKIDDGSALNLSNFDIGGAAVMKGLKGFIFGERGVWRPGDSLFLGFILEDKGRVLPGNHPVICELYNPQGQISNRIVSTNPVNNFYAFKTKTNPQDPTGDWQAKIKVGGATFTKILKIESIKPNRLKINLDFGGKERLSSTDGLIKGNIESRWLHGAPAKGLRAEINAVVMKGATEFPKFSKYAFEDFSISYETETKEVFANNLNDEGLAAFKADLTPGGPVPGALKVIFKTKVFEEGGDFSIDSYSMPYYSYNAYVGIMAPESDNRMLVTDVDHVAKLVVVDPAGNLLNNRRLEVSMYKMDWRWWWDQSGNNPDYMNDNVLKLLNRKTLNAVNGKADYSFKVSYPEWGRYLIKAKDLASGHSSCTVVYIDWPGYAGKTDRGGGASMLTFFSDKEKYKVGEKIKLTFPSGENGRAFISIENGSRVVETFWAKTEKGQTVFEFEAKETMSPNVFAHITMIQPHSGKKNDLPIRMYGVAPILVENPATKLEPVIEMQEVLKPEQNVEIKISEKNSKNMTYTLAVVDEGLLDLTRFRTPEPWKHFYAREALGVKTWDLYDYVFGAYGGDLERVLAIGGDEELKGKDDDQVIRFKPVVKFFGPFKYTGGTNTHTFKMPNYIGSVRTMVVAGQEGAYGQEEKTTPVRQSLMTLATFPRLLGPNEEIALPVNLFVTEKNIRNVRVQVSTNNLLGLVGDNVQNTIFNKPGDQVLYFKVKTKAILGKATLKILASAAGVQSTYEIEVEVRNPNPKLTRVMDYVLEPGKTATYPVNLFGMDGTNNASIEVSSMAPINLSQRLNYLIRYPHGCIEQTTSSVFPQLFLADIVELTDEQKSKIEVNVKAGIEALKKFQVPDGGFAYWPGNSSSDEWGSSYAGHFLIEAQAKGYAVPESMLSSWIKYQQSRATLWRKAGDKYIRNDLIMAYRLYTLALADKPDMPAMNRLRESGALSVQAAYRLAATYALAGQKEVAQGIIQNIPAQVENYREMDYTYGSTERDKAMLFETLYLTGDATNAYRIQKEITDVLNTQNYWMSTHALSYSLLVISKYTNAKQNGGNSFKYEQPGAGEKSVASEKPVVKRDLNLKGDKVEITNQSKGILYVKVVTEGIPLTTDDVNEEKNLNMTIQFRDAKGGLVDINNIPQGTNLFAEVTVSNPGILGEYRNLALSNIFPAGWEIQNNRLDNSESAFQASIPTYQDIRDDKVLTYFNLKPGERKTFRIMLNASYAGKYYFPSASCEAMYDNTIYAIKPGLWVNVVKKEVNP